MSTTFHKFTVLGEGGVGKTALTTQFISSHFVEYYDPTIESSYRQQKMVDDQMAFFEVLDTAGQEEYWSALSSQWIRFGQGFLLLYAINSRHSFETVDRLREQIVMVKECEDENPPMVLVGTKKDLVHDREVSAKEAKELATSYGIDFVETSALTKENVDEAFFMLVRKCRARANPDVVNDKGKDQKVKKSDKKGSRIGRCTLF